MAFFMYGCWRMNRNRGVASEGNPLLRVSIGFSAREILEIVTGSGRETDYSVTESKMIQFVPCFHYKKRAMCVK